MAERAHPKIKGFQDKYFGLIKSKYRKNLYSRYKFCNPYIKNKRVLDIPSGLGWGTSLLKGYNYALGIDIDKESIDYANKHYSKRTREFKVGQMESIPIEDNSFDVIICLEGIEHVDKDRGSKFIEEVQRVLVKGGLLIVTCPVLNELGKATKNPYHLYEYPEVELIDILNKKFRIEFIQRFKGPEGPEYKIIVRNLKGVRYG